MRLTLGLTVFLVIGFLADFNGRHILCPTLEVMRVLISHFANTDVFVVNVMLFGFKQRYNYKHLNHKFPVM